MTIRSSTREKAERGSWKAERGSWNAERGSWNAEVGAGNAERGTGRLSVRWAIIRLISIFTGEPVCPSNWRARRTCPEIDLQTSPQIGAERSFSLPTTGVHCSSHARAFGVCSCAKYLDFVQDELGARSRESGVRGRGSGKHLGLWTGLIAFWCRVRSPSNALPTSSHKSSPGRTGEDSLSRRDGGTKKAEARSRYSSAGWIVGPPCRGELFDLAPQPSHNLTSDVDRKEEGTVRRTLPTFMAPAPA